MEIHEAQKLVYVIGMAVGGLIEAMGMHAENQHCISRGEVLAYDEEAFQKVVDERGLHHNDILGMLRD